MLKFHNLIKNANPSALAARDEYTKFGNKQQFHQDIIRICRSIANAENTAIAKVPIDRKTPAQDSAIAVVTQTVIPENSKSISKKSQKKDPSSIICRHFLEGKCNPRGKVCKFLHDISALQSDNPNMVTLQSDIATAATSAPNEYEKQATGQSSATSQKTLNTKTENKAMAVSKSVCSIMTIICIII